MFRVHDYVKYAGLDNSHIGKVVKVEQGYVDVFFKYPKPVTKSIATCLLEVVPIEEYSNYLYEQKYCTGNAIIDSKPEDLNISIEQWISDPIFGCTHETVKPTDLSFNMVDGDSYLTIGFDTSYIYTRPEFKQHKEWKKALKQVYIEMALQTGDEDWFNELTKEE